MNVKKTTLLAALAVAALAVPATASSHREALAVLNEPCADNTDTYAWVSDGAHDKLYLIMNFNPLHEPGQGNQGFRACNGYRYEFHIGKGTSLKDEAVYRVEFKNTLTPEAAPSASDGAGRRQRAALAAHRRHRDDDGDAAVQPLATRRGRSSAPSLAVLPNNHGPQTDRLIYGLGSFAGYQTPATPTAAQDALYDQAFVDTFIHTLANGGRVIAGQFDDPYQLDEKGIFDLVNLGARRPRRHRRRAHDADRGRLHRLQRLLDRPRDPDHRPLPERHPAQRHAGVDQHRQPAAHLVEHLAPADADRRPRQRHHRAQGLRQVRAGRPQRAAAVQRRPRRHAAPHQVPAQHPAHRRDQLRRRHPLPGAGARRRRARHLRGARSSRPPRWPPSRARASTSSTPSTSAARFPSPTAPPATSSPSTPPSTRASPTAGASAAGRRPNAPPGQRQHRGPEPGRRRRPLRRALSRASRSTTRTS